MTAEIIPFNFESASNTIRVVEIDGEPWFVAKDVMAALEYAEATLSNVPDKISNVPDVWKGRHPMATLGGLQDLWILSESGLYFFVGRCDKPKALPFQLWIAGEVLPTLRKRGYYGELKPAEMLRFHTALSRTVRQLETTQTALSQNILLQQVRGICSILKVRMPEVALLRQKPTQLDLEAVS
jgi:prophage antirepressor-like protein